MLNDNLSREEVEKAITELGDRFVIWVYPNGDIEPYMGPFIGTNHFVEADLVRAWARRYEPKIWWE